MPSDPKIKDSIREAILKDGFTFVSDHMEPSMSRTISIRELEDEEGFRRFYIPKGIIAEQKKHILIMARPDASFVEALEWAKSKSES